MKINHIARKLTVIVIMMAFAFTSIPFSEGSLTADAASKTTLYASASGQHGAYLSWGKIKGAKGYAVFRNGGAIAHLGKGARSFGDSGLAAGASYSYQVRAYKKKVKKTKMWRNKYTGALRKKKPSKKDRKNWKRVTFKKTTYKYGKKTPVRYITTARAVASSPSTNTGNTGGGGSSTPTTETKTVTDYLGVTRTITNKNMNWGKPIYDRTVDGEWDNFIQRNSITFHYDGASVDLYNGDLDKVKIAIAEPTEAVATRTFWQGDEYKKTRYFVKSTDGKYRLAESGKDFIEIVPSTGSGTYKGKVRVGYTDSPHGCGFINADIHYTIGYDFNGDGDASDAGETLVSTKTSVTADTDRIASINICQAAVTAAGTNSYDADMQAISEYISTNYQYGKKVDGTTLMMRCVDGAYILETWSIYKYGVYGYIAPYSSPQSDDVDFWPENNPYSARASWHAQGHH